MMPADEWNLDALPDEERRCWLTHPPSCDELLAEVVGEAGVNLIVLKPDRRCRDGSLRAIAKFLLSRRVFDQLFHGRSGYRAQYYLSPTRGSLQPRPR